MKRVFYVLVFVLFSVCVCSCTVERIDGYPDSYGGNNNYETPDNNTNQRNFFKITPYVTGDETGAAQNGNNGEVQYHYVTEGQDLKQIASIYGCDFQALLQYNGLSEDSIIYVDQLIIIPPITNNNVISGGWGNGNIIQKQEIVRHEPGYYSGVTYTTDYNSLLNIEHACADINGIIVPANYRFSWFRDVGPCIDGYEEALVLDDNYEPTLENPNPTARGGGVCVVSSCLRNAVEAVVGLENILEAHNHTKNGVPIDMSYATIDHQASLNYSGMDFRFYNPYPYPLLIEASFDWSSQTCYVSVTPQ